MGIKLRDAVCYLIDEDGNPFEVCPASIEDLEFGLSPEAEAEFSECRFAVKENISEVRIECTYDLATAKLIARMNKEFATYRRLLHIVAHTKKRRIRKKAVKRIAKLGWRESR